MALNGLIQKGVPSDWATHMIGHELTALYEIDHARTLAIIGPNLYKVMFETKKEKLAQIKPSDNIDPLKNFKKESKVLLYELQRVGI